MNPPIDWIENLYRKNLKRLQPYQSIEPPAVVAQRLGLPVHSLVKIDANENPYGFSEPAKAALANAQSLHYYPDPNQTQLRALIANYAKVNADQVVAGAGADELIDLLCRLFLNQEDQALIFPPTFGFYEHAISLSGAETKCLYRQQDFSISTQKLAGFNWQSVKLVFLCSPNNPTGQLLDLEVLKICLQQKAIIVVDEAYFEFAEQSFVHLLVEHPNLIVLRTFSKLFAMAGLRLGYGLMNPQITQMLLKIKPPYNINVAAETCLQVCLEHLDEFKTQALQIRQLREQLLHSWNQIPGVTVFPSQANFLLIRFETTDAVRLQQKLAKKGILVRSYQTPELKNCLRFSIGTQSDMQLCQTVLLDILNQP